MRQPPRQQPPPQQPNLQQPPPQQPPAPPPAQPPRRPAAPPLADPQLRPHDPHAGLHHPAYEPQYGAIDNAVDAPHRPSPGPDYIPVDPVMRRYQEPAAGEQAYGWSDPQGRAAHPSLQQLYQQQPHQLRRDDVPAHPQRVAAGYPPAPTAPDPTLMVPPERRPRSMDGLVHEAPEDAGFGERARAFAGRVGAMGSGLGAALLARTGAWWHNRRLRREEAKAQRARQADLHPTVEDDRARDLTDAAGARLQPPRQARQPQKPTARERRWQRRRRRHITEEILGWILVPIILVALYYALIGGLALFGMTLDDLMEGLQMIRAQFG